MQVLAEQHDRPVDIAEPRRMPILFLALALFALFAATGHYSDWYGTDPFTNAAQARAFAADQDPILEELEGFAVPEHQGSIGWLRESPGGTTSQYPPGAALWATPFYFFDSSITVAGFTNDDGVSLDIAVPTTKVPATLAAVLSVTLALLFFGLTLAPLMPERSVIASMLIAGLGTSAWSVAADRLWQHGPAMMCISIGTYLCSRDRFALGGLAFGAGTLVRPHTAIIAASIGIAIAIGRRSIKEMVVLGVTSAFGLVALVSYNNAVFGSYSISGGYGSVFAERVAGSSVLLLLERLVLSLVHLRVGMIWTSPFLVLAFWALWKHRRSNPDWAVGAAIGGFLYLVIQFRANRVTGGAGFFSYRYPLEALMAAGPMLAVSTWMWLKDGERRKRVFNVFVGLAIVAHGGAGFLLQLQNH